MLSKRSRRNLALCMVFVIVFPFAIYANIKMATKEVRRLNRSCGVEETDYERRLGPVREMLPKEGVVGYVTDEAMDPLEKTRYLYLTQYSLCPLIVVKGKDQPFVIAYSKDVRTTTGPQVQGLTLTRDFGDGIRLYRNFGG